MQNTCQCSYSVALFQILTTGCRVSSEFWARMRGWGRNMDAVELQRFFLQNQWVAPRGAAQTKPVQALQLGCVSVGIHAGQQSTVCPLRKTEGGAPWPCQNSHRCQLVGVGFTLTGLPSRHFAVPLYWQVTQPRPRFPRLEDADLTSILHNFEGCQGNLVWKKKLRKLPVSCKFLSKS